ncbi:unnamed protein product [Clonostachys rosea]|uniref:Uncharacterized protein n=1 Tax=Bionectria ochroleuca TaxID=29856 RepID=A0ABY6TTG8_BIOOC|nr:unnamed protein product [Clonostachys rosea]
MDSSEVVQKVVATKRGWRDRKVQARANCSIIMFRLQGNGGLLLSLESLPYHTDMQTILSVFESWDTQDGKETDYLVYCMRQRLDWIMEHGVPGDQLEAAKILEKLKRIRLEDSSLGGRDGGVVFKAIEPKQPYIEGNGSPDTWKPFKRKDQLREMRECFHQRKMPVLARKVEAYGIYARVKTLIERHESRDMDGDLTEEQLELVDAMLAERSDDEKDRERALGKALKKHAPFWEQ